MRKLNGYTHFDFMRDDFMLSQYFILIDKINEEIKAEQDAMKKSKNGRK